MEKIIFNPNAGNYLKAFAIFTGVFPKIVEEND